MHKNFCFTSKNIFTSILNISFIFCCTFTFFLNADKLSENTKQSLEAYILQDYHPIKPILDALFSRTRATFNLESLEKAGFIKAKPRKFTNLIVTKHPDIPGYIFKMYLDSQRFYKRRPEYDFWERRILGAQKIRNMIESYQLQNIFKVPQKWIYVLPEHPYLPQGYPMKQTILVEEDMDILPNQENKQSWGSELVTQDLLQYLWKILKELGLSDCAKPDNIPFSRDGRIAFIDTEIYGEKKIKSKKLTPFLSKVNQVFWKELTE